MRVVYRARDTHLDRAALNVRPLYVETDFRYARIPRTTFPCTSVSRMSRPEKWKVRRV